jgi:amino acid adenylation domain-containing protein
MIKLIQEYFSESAKKFPDKIAVNFKNQNISFGDLERETNQLARALKEKGVQRGDRVCFSLLKSLNALKAVLGILKADAVYVPLNVQTPEARLLQIVEDVAPRLIVCDNRTLSRAKVLGNIFNLDEEKNLIDGQSADELSYENNSDELAYIFYTSGSTGKPKGVMIRHSNVINATDWAVEEFGISSADRMSQHPPLHFDLSVFDLFCAFKSGAALFLVPEELSLFPEQLAKFIEEKKLTIWNSVPSVMVHMAIAGSVKPGRFPELKKIFFNGEGFPAKFLAEWMKTFPKKEFVNMYGPTETTVQCTFYRVPEPPKDLTKFVPIGKAQRNVEVFDVDGELYVAGAGVGAGYWNNPEKTAASFILNPRPGKSGIVYKTGDLVRLREDGNYEFLGRKDNQVKVRGNRIELGDVEAALYSLTYVNEAAAAAVPDAETGGNKLAAFVDLNKPKKESEIKNDLNQIVPPYLIADEIIETKLPKTSTGKIDRPTLLKKYYDLNP